MIKRDSKTEQGNVGLGQAIAYFVASGYTVSIPLNDSQKYDLIVEKEGILQRVQVKTTAHRQNESSWTVQLKTTGSNTTSTTTKLFDSSSCELLFVLTDDWSMYSIPTSEISAKHGINIGNKYTEYKVSFGR